MYDIERLNYARLERGWTVKEFARRCNRNEATLRQIFRKHRGRPETVMLMANVLGIDLKDIVIRPNGDKKKRAS
jgi:transcriptional regulator with XRE-family HTH domain